MRPSNSTPATDGEVLDVKPLRSLAPMFPAPFGVNAYTQSTVPPVICVTPGSQYPPGFNIGNTPGGAQYFPFTSQESVPGGDAGDAVGRGTSGSGGLPNGGPINATPISSFKTPVPLAVLTMDDEEDEPPTITNHTTSSGRKVRRPSSFGGSSSADGSNGVKLKRPKLSRKANTGNDATLLPTFPQDPREAVEAVLMTYDSVRRRHLQLDEVQDAGKRADLKAGNIMMSSNLRANVGKRVGAVPGVDIGDIFYFRFELCIVGLHAPIMGGIDYLTTKYEHEEDSIAICIVSAGGYDNDEEDADVLVYTGSGGNNRHEEKQDQKLERGNLALERSVYRKNEIRVIRGYKDPIYPTVKVYIYDGLYKIQESWKEKSKYGTNTFKYKLVREPGQQPGAAQWKLTQKWIANPTLRGKVILPDLSSGAENVPVCLVNEVDNEKGPSLFTYATQVKYFRPVSAMPPLDGCQCASVCLPGDANCGCAGHNGGDLPFNASGLLVSRRPVVRECGSSCRCSINCRNRVTQKGVRLHFEVFKTSDRGWGLRSWDAIRAGMFICEFTGEVIDELKVNLDDEEDDYVFQALCPGEKTLRWNYGPELMGEPSYYVSADAFEPLPIKISAKKSGNVARFMNHSCSPNVFWQPVLHDHGDEGHPHIMFFALKHIPPMTELTYDYGVRGGDDTTSGNGAPWIPKTCLCRAANCRGYFG